MKTKVQSICCTRAAIIKLLAVITLFNGLSLYMYYSLCNPPIHFIHIPKTGGTVVEEQGLAHGYLWGSLFYPVCTNAYFTVTDWRHQHHVPPRYYTPNDGQEPLVNALNSFCVVRDPYARVQSELNFRKMSCGEIARTHMTFLYPITNYVRDSEEFPVVAADMYAFHHEFKWHFAPQYLYTRTSDGRPTCAAILHTENLTMEFNELMERRGQSARLRPHKTAVWLKSDGSVNGDKSDGNSSMLLEQPVEESDSTGFFEQIIQFGWRFFTGTEAENLSKQSTDPNCHADPRDFNKKALRLVNTAYARDFVELGYKALCARKHGRKQREYVDPLECPEIRQALSVDEPIEFEEYMHELMSAFEL